MLTDEFIENCRKAGASQIEQSDIELLCDEIRELQQQLQKEEMNTKNLVMQRVGDLCRRVEEGDFRLRDKTIYYWPIDDYRDPWFEGDA